jgi:hypothetical protein
MPEAVTIIQNENPALSPENEEMLAALAGEGDDKPAELLAGKYKSVEDLEKAYKELQAKLGRGESTTPDTEDDDTTTAADDQAEDDDKPAGDAREIYGDLIGGKLDEAGIDFQEMNVRWQQSGTLESGDYDQLAEAGFNRDMVDAYLSGLQYKAAQDTALSVKEVTSIKESLGGEAEYNKMIQWAGANLPPEEVEGFNQIINTQPMSAVKMAVAGLHARYTAVEGREPRLIGGRASKGSSDKFESTAQLVEAMSDPRYSKDPAYQRKVQEKAGSIQYLGPSIF